MFSRALPSWFDAAFSPSARRALRRRVTRIAASGAAGVACALWLGCATAPSPVTAEPAGAGARAAVAPAVPTRPAPTAEAAELIAEVEAIESSFGTARADVSEAAVVRFRLDRVRADLVNLVASGDDSYEVLLALGRTLALASEDGHQGADHLAIALLQEAARTAPYEAEPVFRRARLLLGMGQARAALEALERAAALPTAASFPEIGLYQAIAYDQLGDPTSAIQALAPYQAAHPDDARAQHLSSRLNPASERAAGSISLGVEGRSVVAYAVEGATWRMSHETLGFAVGLPLSWQIAEEQVSGGEGFVEITAPPVAGAEHVWRSDAVTIWAVTLGDGAGLQSLTQAYSQSFEDLAELQELPEPGRTDAKRLRLRRAPFFGEPLLGEALLVVDGSTGYVLEFWGDTLSFPQTAPQAAEIMRTFEPLSTGTVPAPKKAS